jgi:hypothetical protein
MLDMCPCSATDIKLGLNKVERKAKPLKYSEKVVFCTNLEQVFKCMATDLDTQLMMRQRLICAQKCQVAA